MRFLSLFILLYLKLFTFFGYSFVLNNSLWNVGKNFGWLAEVLEF